jgi:hypothetical protein
MGQGRNAVFLYGTAQWDLIVIAYEPFPVSDESYVRRLRNALWPGGLLVIQSFASESTAANRRSVDIEPEALNGTGADGRTEAAVTQPPRITGNLPTSPQSRATS